MGLWFKHRRQKHHQTKGYSNNFKSSMKQRAIALFLCSIFVMSSAVPTASALAAGVSKQRTPKALAVAAQTATVTGGTLGTGTAPSMQKTSGSQQAHKETERVDLRTENTETYDLGNGKSEVRTYLDRVHYKQDGKWQKIDTSLIEDANAADSTSLIGKAVAFVKEKVQDLHTFKVKANDWQARFAASNDKVGMVRVQSDGKDLGFSPIKANVVTPSIKTLDGMQYVEYKNLWDGVDVIYEVDSSRLKETVLVNSLTAETSYSFKIMGETLKKNKDGTFGVPGSEQNLSPLSVSLTNKGVLSEKVVTQEYKNGNLVISLDKKWFKNLSKADLPAVIDPTWNRSANADGNYIAYKSDGYVCNSNTCWMNAGSLYDNGWKRWRTVFRIDFNVLQGKQLLGASMHLRKSVRSWWTGTTEGLYTEMSHANCLGYNCIDYGAPRHSAWFGSEGWMDITALMQSRMNIGDWGAWFELNGEERNYTTMKGFDGSDLYFTYTYNSGPSITSPVTPADGQVVVTDQPLLQINPSSDPDGDAVKYYYRVATSPDAESGSVVNSGWLDGQTSYTVPEGALQDGVTYYWHVYSYDGNWQSNPNWVRSFKVDLRTGQDSAASFDDGGPIDVNLATGNATTSVSTQDFTALGGSVGLNFAYNSPYRSKPGLVGQYFNNTSFSGNPVLERVETNIDFPWGTGSPAPGVVNADGFGLRLTGYFIAPKTGSYKFGFSADDNYALYLNNESSPVVSAGCCAVGNWNMAARTFTEGQIVPIRVDFTETGGPGNLSMSVSIDGATQPIQSSWLRTAPRPVQQNNGLMARYYYDSGNHVFPTDDSTSMFLQRRETNLYFNWGENAAVASGPTDHWLTRFTGYFTAPVSGNFQFGTGGDDGTRIFLNGSTTAYRTDWADRGWTMAYGGDVYLTAGQTIPITVEYYEQTGGAAFGLYVRGAVAEQVIPSTWLSTKVNPLPAGWQMSIDADGDLAYDYASIQPQSVILYDAEGEQHEYKWDGAKGSYVPGTNEYGTLTKNGDGTLTLIDSDGKTYTFDSSGRITSVTLPTDDRKPAALKYVYSGTPVRLKQIVDGVDPNRTGTLYYSGEAECGTAPSGYDTAPANMLCAFRTYDGRTTYLYYKNGLLARIVSPGNETTTLGYDSLGRIIQHQSSTAYDAVQAGVRADNESVTSQIVYDILGRASSITMPAASEGGFRAKHSYTYLNNATQTNEIGEVEPKGYSQRVEYDNLYRTVKSYDKAGIATSQEWDSVKDLQLSSTDATGLKSTTIYSASDMPTDSYGPAPSAWFGTDRKPLAPYASQVPHTSTVYDGNIKGFGVTWFNYRSSNGSFVGAPKLHTTGFSSPTDPSYSNPAYIRHDYRTSTLPVTADVSTTTGVDGYGFSAVGRITFPASGIYTFKSWSDDSVRLYVDDTQMFNNWGTKTEGIAQNVLSNTFTATAGKSYRIKLDYGHVGTMGVMDVWLAGPSIADVSGQGLGTRDWSPYLTPDYGLQTSQTVYGAATANGATTNITNTTNYGNNPELGLATNTTVDPTGLALTATSTYEPQGGADSYLRQTSSSLPGGATTNYAYYGATEMRDNPCTDTIEAYRQGGMLKLKTEPDPDGASPQTGRTTETIYDDTGKVVATRYNNDPWTCTSYDVRERIMQTTVPTYNGQAARTVTNLYAVNGNPLITSSTDNEGTIQVETDLLGRNIRYIDARGNITTSEYDNSGHLTKRVSLLGTETFTYDDYDRLVSQKLDNNTLATSTYDTYSRLQSVSYQTGLTLDLTRESTTEGLGRLTKRTYTTSTGQTLSDEVVRAVTGDVISGTELGQAKSYSYDTAGRLTAATVAGNTFTYGYGTQDSSCSSLPGANANAGKDSNRTSQTVNGVATTYCYDQADRLIASSNVLYDAPAYDSHGNTISLGSTDTKTYFTYDSSDRNVGVTETNGTGSVTTTYARDVQGRLKYRHHDTNGSQASDDYYGYTASGDSPDFITNLAGVVTEKYFTLPGDVLLTVRPSRTSAGSQTLSLPNIHGDIFATIDADGAVLTISQTGPFGEVLAASTVNTATPWNTLNNASFQYVGQHEKLTEVQYAVAPVQMGARVYIPALGRFLGVDPMPGGTANSYVYALDPVNEFDLDGNWLDWRKIGSIAVVVAGVAAAVACGASVVCGIAAGAVAAGAAYAVKNAGTKNFKWTGLVKETAIGGTLGAIGGLVKVSGTLGKAAMNSKIIGTASKKFANPSIANKVGNAVKSGTWNNKQSIIRTGWSVHSTAKRTLPVLRTSIGFGKKAVHLNWKYGRFY